MEITKKTRKSHAHNEDRYIIGYDFYMVIDGATPLIKDSFNRARWMVDRMKLSLKKRSILTVIDRLNKISKELYDELPTSKKDKDYLPSASLSFVTWDDKYFYAYILGDCEVTFILKNNVVFRCFQDELSKLDDISINELIKVSKEKNIHINEAREYINDILIKHRRLINQENGYKAFTLSDKLNLNPKCYKIKKEDVNKIYLYSDGFAQSFDTLNIYNSHEEMFNHDLSLDDEIKKIVDTSFKDPYCDRYPRFKKIDDITVIKVTLDK